MKILYFVKLRHFRIFSVNQRSVSVFGSEHLIVKVSILFSDVRVWAPATEPEPLQRRSFVMNGPPILLGGYLSINDENSWLSSSEVLLRFCWGTSSCSSGSNFSWKQKFVKKTPELHLCGELDWFWGTSQECWDLLRVLLTFWLVLWIFEGFCIISKMVLKLLEEFHWLSDWFCGIP